MKKDKELFTVSIYTENNIGLLNRISAIFLKRHVNIESLTSSQSEIDDIYRFVILVNVSEIKIKRIIKQIEKQIEVIAAFYHTDKETIFLKQHYTKLNLNPFSKKKTYKRLLKIAKLT